MTIDENRQKSLKRVMVMVVNDENNQYEDDDGDGGADVDCGEKHSQFYIQLPIVRPWWLYW